MSDIRDIIAVLTAFRDERDWAQFHNAKDLALAINVEAGELLELFLWKGSDEADSARIREELADVLAFSFLLADRCGLDVKEIVLDKIEQNRAKYPVEKSRGTAKKYTDL